MKLLSGHQIRPQLHSIKNRLQHTRSGKSSPIKSPSPKETTFIRAQGAI